MEKTDLAAALDMIQRILAELEQINKRIDLIIEGQEEIPQRAKPRPEIEKLNIQGAVLDVMTLLSLPDHLRKTATTLCALGEATADEVAGETKRARAAESNYLNQLVTMGHLKKKKRGRSTHFYVEK